MLKLLKQEFLFIPIMAVLMECLRWLLYHFYPETALFDKGSELETFFFCLWQIVWISSSALILLRIVFPPSYYAFKDFYHTLKDRSKDERHTASIIFYLAFFFGMIWLVSGKAATPESMIRKKLVDTLHSQLYIREATGRNDGVEVEKYLTFVGRFKGDAWCAAFASWNLHAVGITAPPNPKSGWSPNFSTPQYTIWSHELVKKRKEKAIHQGDCFTLYYNDIKRVGHVGFIVDEKENYFITIEGNTGTTGSREGSGVHKYKRPKSKVYRVTNYITPFITHYEKITSTHSRIGPAQLLSQALNQNSGKNTGANKYILCEKGFDLLHRQPVYVESRQFNDKHSDQCGVGKYHRTGSNLPKSTDQTLRECKVRQPGIYLQLSSAGIAVEDKEPAYPNAFIHNLKKAGYKIHSRHEADSFPPFVGENPVLDWRC